MDIVTTLCTQKIIINNKCQMRFLDNFVWKQNVDNKLMITELTCSMLESPSTSDDDDMNTGLSK